MQDAKPAAAVAAAARRLAGCGDGRTAEKDAVMPRHDPLMRRPAGNPLLGPRRSRPAIGGGDERA